ncbi:MAG: glycosyl hydrolase family 57 [bacterium]
MEPLSDIINGLPNFCGYESSVEETMSRSLPVFLDRTPVILSQVESSFGIALHMHQPLIPAGGPNLKNAAIIGNLQYMMENQHIHDNHNAPVFARCYARMADFIKELVDEGKSPRVMLDYSGNLFYGLRQMGRGDILEKFKNVMSREPYSRCIEWLGTMWSHAVASSTPPPDLKLHIQAWQQHFASIFGWDALARVRGFSPPEMHLPIHPDVCHEYVKTLKACGFRWLMVQEHTVENLDGGRIRNPHVPHLLTARNSRGEEVSMTALVKTKGSDTKLVAQMQPYAEARGLRRQEFGGKSIPPFVLQIGDGENGGVMMNEFPEAFKSAFRQIGTSGTVSLCASEYLELLEAEGIDVEKSALPVQPVGQKRIWDRVSHPSPDAVRQAISDLEKQDRSFHLDMGSWTNDRSWVKGYEGVLSAMEHLSALFHQKIDQNAAVDRKSPAYQQALFYLLVSQTSCYRYWGQGAWTDYGLEICRRGREFLEREF